MVLNRIFSKSSSQDKDKNKDQEKDKDKKSSTKAPKDKKNKDRDHYRDRPRSKDLDRSPSRTFILSAPDIAESPLHSPHSSPTKSSSPHKSPTKSSLYHHHSRSSSAASKHSFFSSSRHPQSRDSHPLNLPPDELRRHLSAMAAAREDSMRNSMEIDHDIHSSPQVTDSPSAAQQETPLATTNGAQNGERSPTPPPHRSSSQTDGGESFKLTGNKFYKTGDYERAIQEYNKALEINPNSPIFLSNRAAAFLSANRFLEALEDAQRALELDPGNPKIMHRLARIYTSLGRPAEALDVLSKVQPPASAKDRVSAESMLRFITQAEETLKGGKGGSLVLFAIDQARQLLGTGVKPRKWILMAGEAHLKIGNENAYGKAHDVAISLLRENNQDPDALLLRARAYYGQGDNDQALKYLRMCLGLDPDNTQAVKLLRMIQKLVRTKEEGNTAFKTKNFQRAVELYTQGVEIDPTNKDIISKLLQNRAQAHLALKNYDRAIDDCTEALRLDPAYLKAQKIRAKVYGAAGNWEEAVKDYKSVAESNPSEKGIQEDIHHAEFELKKSRRKDYYKILGVSKDANDAEIKKAYRKMAIQHHPDKQRDGEGNDEKFKEVGEAYETLIDPQKRTAYDNGDDLIDPSEMFGHGGSPFATNMGGMGGTNINIDPNILFNMMNGGGGGGGFAHAGGHPFAGTQSRGSSFGGFPF